ncbi:acyltransferase [Bradyrhizobium sp. STM 3843]|uniref:acyltransferase family protein n=1 Tax=Bradyrhizobium sp. STM 3843 TaxID=551947 RepID=UPI0011126FF2|nr:acyltransferase [Bradyrhizobium sp. STM 3843]
MKKPIFHPILRASTTTLKTISCATRDRLGLAFSMIEINQARAAQELRHVHPNRPKQPTHYYYAIDVLRFLAALSVVGFHYAYVNQVADFQLVWPLTWFGWVGVEIFFVISGFVIANSANGSSPLQFLKGRALRLLPAPWLCATITFALLAPNAEILPYLRSLVLLPKGPWISPVYWTLAVEIVFYAVIFIVLFINRFQYINRLALLLTMGSGMYMVAAGFQDWYISDHMNVLLLRHGCFFATGIWLWLSTTRQLSTWEYLTALIAIAACITEICLRGAEFLPREMLTYHSIAAPVATWLAAVLCIAITGHAHLSIPPRMATVVRHLGLITYPLYLVHDEIGRRAIRALTMIGIDKWLSLALALLMVIVLSWLVSAYWEPAVRRAFNSASERLMTRRAAPAP